MCMCVRAYAQGHAHPCTDVHPPPRVASLLFVALYRRAVLHILCHDLPLACSACSMRLLQNTSRGVGDLIMVYKRMSGLAGHTSRVAELLEQV
jgi:hypothetical protein